MRKPRAPRRPNARGNGPHPGLIRSPTATLLFFAAIGLLLWGRLLLKEVPQTASAVEPATEAIAGPTGSPDADATAEAEGSGADGGSAGQVAH